MQSFKTLFPSGPYMPHGYCFLWNPGLIGLHVISDLVIALPYLSILFTLGYFVRKRRDLPFHWMFLCFGVFILACGAAHGMDSWTLWHANYWVSGSIQVIRNGMEAMNSVSDRLRMLVLQSHAGASGVEVTVQDSGTGLDPRHVPHLFDTFLTTKATGMGMGSSISRSIIEVHRGRLWTIPNGAAHGAAFHFSLPVIA